MRSSTSHFDQRVPLSKIRAFLRAWYAVRHLIRQEDFLEWCQRVYEAKYRRSYYPMPFDVVFEHGKVIQKSNPEFEPFWERVRNDPTGDETGEPIMTTLESEDFARKLEIVEEELARINVRRPAAIEQVEALEDEKDDAIARGAVLSARTKIRPPKDRGRPRLPFPWFPVLACIAIACLIQFEGYQLALPFLDLIGVDTTNLPREWQRNPIGVISGAGFALSASVGLFFVWYLVLRSASLISKTWQSTDPGMTALRVAGIFALCCILLVGSYLLANMRHGMANDISRLMEIQQGQQSGGGMGKSVFFFLTLLVPFAAAYLHHQMAQSVYWVRRRDIILKQEEWDLQEEERRLADERLAERSDLRQQRRERLERERTQLQNQLRALTEHAQAAQRQRLERLAQARKATEFYARSLHAALQQDFYYYLRAVHRCQAEHLLPEQVRQTSQPFVYDLLPNGRNGQQVS